MKCTETLHLVSLNGMLHKTTERERKENKVRNFTETCFFFFLYISQKDSDNLQDHGLKVYALPRLAF